jgi:hypothetical protein
VTGPSNDPLAVDAAAEPTLVIRVTLGNPAPRTPPPPDATPMRVVTEGAVCLFAPATMTAVRLRRDGAELRRDGEPLMLLSWPEPIVGHSMALQLQVREDGVSTTRISSTVLGVENAP